MKFLSVNVFKNLDIFYTILLLRVILSFFKENSDPSTHVNIFDFTMERSDLLHFRVHRMITMHITCITSESELAQNCGKITDMESWGWKYKNAGISTH